MQVGIYVLTDGENVYVGKSINPKERFKANLREANNPHIYGANHTKVVQWLLNLDELPRIKIVEWCSPMEWYEREQHWIERFCEELGEHKVMNPNSFNDGLDWETVNLIRELQTGPKSFGVSPSQYKRIIDNVDWFNPKYGEKGEATEDDLYSR